MPRPKSFILPLLALVIVAVGCSRTEERESGIYDGGSFKVYADSIIREGTVYRALSDSEITGAWKAPDTAARHTRYSSGQLMADALFNKALCEAGTYSTEDIYLSLGLLRPEESMEALRAIAAMPVPDNEYFPSSALDPMWGPAAWEVYCASGSRQWLKEAYDRLTASLERQRKINNSGVDRLMCGAPRYVLNPEAYYPEWMDAMDRFTTVHTSVNICRAYSLEIASRMAHELRRYAERELQSEADKVSGAVNDRLWLPDRQRYGQCLYGSYYPIVSTISDNRANLLAILFDIATPEMSAAMLESMPLLKEGVPAVYPTTAVAAEISPSVQTMAGLSAAKTHNPSAFRIAASTLWNLALNSRQPAQWPAMVLKGIFGISLTPEGMSFRPMVTADFPGNKRISGLRYRDALLDIQLNGTGDRVASFTLDSLSTDSPFIPAELSGEHKIVITLSGNDLQPGKVTVQKPSVMPEGPKVQWNPEKEARIVNFIPESGYEIYINGTMMECIRSDRYVVTDTGASVVDIVPVGADGFNGFSPRAHICAPSEDRITVNASSVTPRRPPLHFIKDRATATNYIELAARHNTRITCYVNAPSEGEYFLTVGYSNGSTHCALRTLTVNDSDVATIVFPPRRALDWISVYPSTTATVRLKAGTNKIALTYIQGTILLNKISLLRKQ